MDSIMLIVIMIAVFYFMIIRPENKRKKRAEEMRNSLKKGERVTTIGGMVGRVVQVNDTTIVFETSEDRVRIEIAKWGIQSTESMEQAAAQKGKKVKKEAEAEEPAKVEEPDQPEEPVVVEAPKEKDAKDYDPEIK
ncbi:MAG: preprotein translocase subunit YajC [Hominicoprocola sp.]|nr:preprotein translocase subunit YajC [Oscillospiraceae bacterium]